MSGTATARRLTLAAVLFGGGCTSTGPTMSGQTPTGRATVASDRRPSAEPGGAQVAAGEARPGAVGPEQPGEPGDGGGQADAKPVATAAAGVPAAGRETAGNPLATARAAAGEHAGGILLGAAGVLVLAVVGFFEYRQVTAGRRSGRLGKAVVGPPP